MLALLPQRTTYELYSCLESPSRCRLWRALAILDTKGLPAAEVMTDLLARDLEDFRRSRKLRKGLIFLTLTTLSLAQSHVLLGGQVQNGASLLFFLLALLTSQFLAVHCTLLNAKRRRIRNLLFLLQESPSICRTGVFVDVMRYGDNDASCLAQAILVETLPQLKDKSSLSQEQHRTLCQALHGSNSSLILAILGAFERIGISRSLRAVRRLAVCPVWLPDAQRIERAACDCLKAIQERAQQQAVAQTLLRATVPPPPPPRHLLRPVEGTPFNLGKNG